MGFGSFHFSPSGARVDITSPPPTASSATITGRVTNPGGSVAGLTVTIRRGGATLGTAETTVDGSWSYAAAGLSSGEEIDATVTIPTASGEQIVAISAPVLLLETGGALLLEAGGRILLET